MPAWRVLHQGVRGVRQAGIYIAPTSEEALATVLASCEAFDFRPDVKDLTCERAPEYDGWAARQGAYRRKYGVVEEVVAAEMFPNQR